MSLLEIGERGLAGERGAFPLFNPDLVLSRGTFASRLPAANARGFIPKHALTGAALARLVA